MSRMACLTAGMVGCGGGPGILFFPSRGGEAAGLQEGIGDHGHQGVPVQAGPGSALKMVEAKLLLELLMCLFADPSGFYSSGKRLNRRVARQVGGIVFPLSGRTTFADQPDFIVAGHGLHTAICHTMPVAIGDPDTGCGELAAQLAFGAPPPADLPPFPGVQHQFG